MALSNKVATFISKPNKYQDASLVWHEGETEKRTVFVNQYSLGNETRSALFDMGLSAEAELEVVIGEYQGENEVEFEGKTYSVISTNDTAGHTRIVLGRRIKNG